MLNLPTSAWPRSLARSPLPPRFVAPPAMWPRRFSPIPSSASTPRLSTYGHWVWFSTSACAGFRPSRMSSTAEKTRTRFRNKSGRAFLIIHRRIGIPSVIQHVSILHATRESQLHADKNAKTVDLIDSMLVVDPDRRFTVDQCLSHPWMLAETPGVNDSTNGLVSGLAGLEVNRRGVVRERTLLSSINTVQVASRVPLGPNRPDLKIYSKNPRATASASPPPKKEVRPADQRDPREFMELGGKGDQELFGNDTGSRYSKDDIAPSKGKGKGKGKASGR